MADAGTFWGNGQALDLTGSTLDLDPGTQILSVTLGAAANLHATFDLAPTSSVISVADVALGTGAIAGAVTTPDATAPTLVSAEQNLTESEFGFVVDFTFSEAMDPVFAITLPSVDAGFPVFASQVEQPADAVLRVTFTEPVIPSLDSVDLTDSARKGDVLTCTPGNASDDCISTPDVAFFWFVNGAPLIIDNAFTAST